MTFTDDPVARSIKQVYPYQVDLENCNQEPLHHIQVVQGHACLLVVDLETLVIKHASENLFSFIGTEWTDALDKKLSTVVGPEVMGQIPSGLAREDGFDGVNPVQSFFTVDGEMKLRNVILHRSSSYLYLEVEKAAAFMQTVSYQQLLSRAIRRIQNITDWDTLFPQTASIIKQVTGYDRVMIYQFDKENNGTVIAEARNSDLEPFEGLRYPHTDIPQRARDLYLINRVRLISGVSDIPSRIHASKSLPAGSLLDLTHVNSRGVSPIHLEYLGYMGVNNSLSVAIILEGKLWGLFALHHYSPRSVDYGTRNVLQFIGQIFSGHLALRAASKYREQVLEMNLVRLAIGDQITKTRDIFEGLSSGNSNLLTLFPGTSGSMVCFEGRTESYGECPPTEAVAALMQQIHDEAHHQHKLYYKSESLNSDFPSMEEHCDVAAGMLVVYLNPTYQDWICWFRPSVIREITWGGKPEKELTVSEDGHRLGPRKSFARYVETVEGCSAEWTEQDIENALALRITVIQSLMQRYVEVREINERLQKAYEDLETFSYTVSHDLRAPLRAINGYAEILEEDYRDKLDEDALQLLVGIQQGVDKMNNFITDILELSRVGNKGLKVDEVNVRPLISEVLKEVRVTRSTSVPLTVEVDPDIPPVMGDERLLRQLYVNLITNAFKYVEPNGDGHSAVKIGYRRNAGMGKTIYFVTNTGPAIPQEYKKTVFEMFMRLSTSTKEGTGVGLAIVERIANRHNGKVWITDDELGVTFNFFFDAENI